jgi:23S rRNA-/tRNA-specific pseudouridylate synthase
MGLAFPKTGRQHQIRVHAMVHGLPLVGDKIYHGGYELFQRFKDMVASKEDHDLMEISRHALHAVALKLTYKGEEKIFRSKLPDDFVDYINLKQFVKINKLEVMISKTLDRVFL